MQKPCDTVEPFVDGELPPEAAEAFRAHLPDCARCQREVADLLQLKLLGRRHVERAPAPARPPPPPVWRRPAFLSGAALAALVLLGVLGVRLWGGPRHDVWLAERPERLLEARLSHPGADAHRPQAARMMGGEGTADALPLEALASLEREDRHGLAAAYLVRDDPGLADQALRELERLGRSPDLDSDRAAALLLKGRPEEALRLTDGALAQRPQHPQALWNRGLALRELGLPLLAAQAFTSVAALGEAGWAQEAARRGESLQQEASTRHARWKAVFDAGRALVEAAPAGLPEGFSQAPIARLLFYDAVRSAPSRERVLALLPLAQALDAHAGGQVLQGYVRRVAEADFGRRGPLARDYAALTLGRLPEPERERLVAALLGSREDDLLLGALVLTGSAARHLETFEARAAASGDPWFKLLAAQERARAEVAGGRWTQAARTLREALQHCEGRGLEYRCIFLERELSGLHIKLLQLEGARRHAERGWRQARASNEWALEGDLLWQLAQIARFVNDAPLARACYEEILAREPGSPDMARRVHQSLATIALHELQVDGARRELDAALATGLPLAFSGAFTLADLARLKRGAEDEAHLTRALEAAAPTQGAGERALATHIRGRFLIETDVERGRALLWKAIEEAGAQGLEEDVYARRARAYSFTSLLMEAGRRRAFGEVMELLDRERGLALPGQCLLVATVDSERTLLVARGAQGELVGHHDESRRHRLPVRLDGLVPQALREALRTCPMVEVLARPPLHGRAGLLPPEQAWSYLTRTTAPRPPGLGPPVHLVVSDVELPPDVPLKRLNRWAPVFGPDERPVQLSGSEATPARVLGAMREATEIDVVAHGIINDSADASYLLLAPGGEGPELGVERVRAAALEGAPFVVLAACHAAHTSYVLHEPFSLPAAFIEAGARGVLAATVEIPDLEAGAFFNAVRERMRAGARPALALRDERVRWLGEGRGARWLDSVLLFE